MADDDTSFCAHCNIHFPNSETLRKHTAAFHPSAVAEVAPESSKASGKRALVEEPADGPSENIELAPLLGVLSDEQKDSLLLRAVQQDPDFYEHIEEQAMLPLTEEAAESRVSSLDAESLATAVRWYTGAGVPGNAVTLLSASSQKCLDALDALAEALPAGKKAEDTGTGDVAEGSAAPEDLLAAVEALPAASVLGALWVELLAMKNVVRQLCQTGSEQGHELQLLLEGLDGAAATVRPAHPAVLVGPNGELVDTIAESARRLQTILDDPHAVLGDRGKKAKKV